MGTGNAWAWQSKAKLVFTDLTNMLPLESLENVGALEPTGSIKLIIIFSKTKYLIILQMQPKTAWMYVLLPNNRNRISLSLTQ